MGLKWNLGGGAKASNSAKKAKGVSPAIKDHEKAETRKVKEEKTPETAPQKARRPRAREEGARPYVREEDGIAQGSPHNEKRKKHYDLAVPGGTKGKEEGGAPEKNRGAAKRSAEERTLNLFERDGGTLGEGPLGRETRGEKRDGGPERHETRGEGEDGGQRGQTSSLESSQGSVLGPESAENGVSQENVTITLSNRPKKGILADLGVDHEEHRKRLKVLPTYACSTCSLSTECPEFKEGYVCAYNKTFEAFPSRDAGSVKEIMTEILGENTKRWRMASLMEKIEGGGRADPNVTRLSEVVMAQAKNLVEFDEELQKVSVSVPVKSLPGMQTKEKGGLLRQLFAPAMPTAPLTHTVVTREEVPLQRDVTHENVPIVAEVMPVEADSRELDSRGEAPPPGSNER